MKPLIRPLLLIPLLWLMGCGMQMPLPTPTAAIPPTATFAPPPTLPTRTPNPTAAPPEPTIPPPTDIGELRYGGVSLFYDHSLIRTIRPQTTAARAGLLGTPPDGPVEYFYDVPDFILLELEPQQDTPTTQPARLLIQPIRDEGGQWWGNYPAPVQGALAELEMQLDEQPAASPLPLFDAVRPQFRYVEFGNGRGLRQVGLISAGPGLLTITNDELFYLYEGVTADGRYWVQFQYPLTVDGLPSWASLEYADPATLYGAQDQASYFQAGMETLAALHPSAFTPDLRQLDLMMQTLFVNALASTSTSLPRPEPACVPDARFMADITVPDGTTIAPRTTFTKTWQLRNTGSCTWSAAFTLTPATLGNPPNLQPATAAPISLPFAPSGADVPLSVVVRTPPVPGYYRLSWQINPPLALEGDAFPPFVPFGPPLYVEVRVDAVAAVAQPQGIWKVVDGDAAVLAHWPRGTRFIFSPTSIQAGDETCTAVTYGGRIATGADLLAYDDLLPADFTQTLPPYLDVVETNCDILGFAQFAYQDTLPAAQITLHLPEGYVVAVEETGD